MFPSHTRLRPGAVCIASRLHSRLKEASHINKSLFMLGHCMALLAAKSDARAAAAAAAAAAADRRSDGPPSWQSPVAARTEGNNAQRFSAVGSSGATNASSAHIPYRSSVLTMLLRESLGGNARTTLLTTLSPVKVSVLPAGGDMVVVVDAGCLDTHLDWSV